MTVEPSNKLQKESNEPPDYQVFADIPDLHDILEDLREALRLRNRAYGLWRRSLSAPEDERESRRAEYVKYQEESDEIIQGLRTQGQKIIAADQLNAARVEQMVIEQMEILLTAAPWVRSGAIPYTKLIYEMLAWKIFVTKIWLVDETESEAMVLRLVQDDRWRDVERLRDQYRGERRQKAGYWRSETIRRKDRDRKRAARVDVAADPVRRELVRQAQMERMRASRAKRKEEAAEESHRQAAYEQMLREKSEPEEE